MSRSNVDTMWQRWPEFLPYVIIAFAAIPGLSLGYAHDLDSYGVHLAGQAIQQGEYVRSRTSGFPLYEAVVAFGDAVGGIVFINLLSLGFVLGSVLYAHRLAHSLGASGLGASTAALAVAIHPLMLTNASAMMETALALLLALGFTDAALKQRHTRTAVLLVLLGVALVCTRIDASLWIAAVLGAQILQSFVRRDWRAVLGGVALGVAIAGAAFAIYVLINGGVAFLSKDFLLYDPFWRRAVRAVLGVGLALNVLGLAMLGGLVIAAYRSCRQEVAVSSQRITILLALCLAALLFGLRFLALPDELEYLIIPVAFVLILGASAFETKRWYVVVAILGLMTNAMTISLFQRSDGTNERLSVQLSVNAGPVVQDYRFRRNNQILNEPAFIAWLARQAGLGRTKLERLPLAYPGFVTPDGVLVLSRHDLYRFDNPRFPAPAMSSASYSSTIVCDDPITPPVPWWRVWQAPPVRLASETFRAGETLHCELLAHRSA